MTVTDAWTDPSEGGSLDRDAGQVLREADWDGVLSNLLVLGGTDGARGTKREVHAPIRQCDGTGSILAYAFSPYGVSVAADGYTNTFRTVLSVPQDFGSMYNFGLLVMPNASGNLRYRFEVAMATIGVGSAGGSPVIVTEAYRQLAVTNGRWQLATCANNTLDGLQPGSVIGVEWTRDGGNVLDTIGSGVHVASVLLRYYTA